MSQDQANPPPPQDARVDVLMVDDSMSDLRVLIEMLAFRNMKVSVALDGERGYKQATTLAPRLILLDVRMPDHNGFDVCRRLKENRLTQSIPVIFVTAANDLEERLQGFAAGGVDYIAKPFEVQEVLARIGVHLAIGSDPGASPGDTVPSERTEAVHSRDAFLVMTAQRLLTAAIKDPPDLETLASLLGVNRRRLNDCFQAICGQPVFGWLREERLRQSYFLVSQTATPFSAIGETLGYSTAPNFSKAFRLRYGFTPGQVRAAMARAGKGAPDGGDAQ